MRGTTRFIRRAAVLTAAVGAWFAFAAPVTAANAATVESTDASVSVVNEPPDMTPSNVGVLACYDSNVRNGGGGATVAKSIYLRNGPNEGCGSSSGYSIPVDVRLGGWCYKYNESGNLWYYVSVGGAAPHGWIYSGNVKNVSTFDTVCS
ncbi:hypothetical protein O7606_04095 [Micromonospora sp. WMMD882]|uniref:hypothetical protein n=1 Tax=Micromonospora sp. WMMD882 TaxID=3015151 RepID=UPI00248CC764|nr:hypothetical protein [Micromonospora sp. WMMD882]WBB80578.1 hypothetical protein O7606_04095 [Micromonospora sp. WMMD882]